MALEGRSAGCVDVDLRHRVRLPAPGRRSRHARDLPRTHGPQARRACDARRSTTSLRTRPRPQPAMRGGRRPLAGRRRSEQARRRTTPSARRPEAGPGPASSASIRTQSAPGRYRCRLRSRAARTAGSSASVERRSGADRRCDEGSRKTQGEPHDEGHEPQRHEVEPVAVVEAVVSPRCARERCDDEQPARRWPRRISDERGRATRT